MRNEYSDSSSKIEASVIFEADITLEVTVAAQEDGQAVKDHIRRGDRIRARRKGWELRTPTN
jgi:hypothetical protein